MYSFSTMLCAPLLSYSPILGLPALGVQDVRSAGHKMTKKHVKVLVYDS